MISARQTRVPESLVGQQVGEGVVELIDSVLSQGVGAESKDGHPGHGECSPVTIEVHVDVGVEDTVSASDCISLYSLTEIAGFLG